MKRIIVLALVLIIAAASLQAQDKKKLPAAKVKNLKSEIVNTADFNNDGKPIVISFWATWCKPCLEEMMAVNDLYSQWKEETGVKIIAISIDDARSSRKVAPTVKQKGWEMEVYLDENSDFKRAMGVNNPPHTFLLNGKGEIVWEHNGYAPGDETKLFEEIQKVLKEESK